MPGSRGICFEVFSRLLTNFLCLPDRLICLNRIDQAGKGSWFVWACLIRLGKGAWFTWVGLIRLGRLSDLHEQDFGPAQKMRQSGRLPNFYWKCKLGGWYYVLPFNPQTFFLAPFPLNLLEYYKLGWRKSENMKISDILGLDSTFPYRPQVSMMFQ